MTNTVAEVLDFVREHDVKFIRLAFCDLFGKQKNISIMPDELESAFENGVSFDGGAVAGFSGVNESDLFLFPEAATLSILPWRPQQGRVMRFYCDIKKSDGSRYVSDTRGILKETLERYEKNNYRCMVGTECEFYLFKTDEDGQPLSIPFDQGGYMDISPLDRGENVRREICLCLEEMGIKPEASHHEQGPGQNEIDFRFSDALSGADNLLTFKTVVKTIAAKNGLFASFMPKPIAKTSGSGLHINLSVSQNGCNLFNGFTQEAAHFIAGVLRRSPEITAFLNPLINSYDRFGSFEAPKYVSWSHQNRSQLVRIPAGAAERARMELRSPDPSANPYLAFSLILAAGFEGIAESVLLPNPIDKDLYTADEAATADLERLPASLPEALKFAENSAFIKNVLSEEVAAKFIAGKQKECKTFSQFLNKQDFYTAYYFNTI